MFGEQTFAQLRTGFRVNCVTVASERVLGVGNGYWVWSVGGWGTDPRRSVRVTAQTVFELESTPVSLPCRLDCPKYRLANRLTHSDFVLLFIIIKLKSFSFRSPRLTDNDRGLVTFTETVLLRLTFQSQALCCFTSVISCVRTSLAFPLSTL